MARNRFSDKKWLNTHLKQIKQRAGNRYTPEHNVDLPIAEIFDGLSRTENFYTLIRKYYGKLNRGFNCIFSKYENKEVQQVYNALKREISHLSEILGGVKEYNTKDIPWGKVNRLMKKANDISWKLSEKLRDEKTKAEKEKPEDKQENRPSVSERIGSDIHYLYETQNELRHFEELSSSIKAKLSNNPFLFLRGAAGTGKTHLLCDVVENRITSKKSFPAVLMFGELFTTTENPFAQVIQQLGLQLNKKQVLRSLDNAGKKSGCRALIVIDALNETRQRNFWKRNLNKVIDEVKKYPNVALVISVRSGFEDEVLTKRQGKVFIHEEHRGFQFREWEAVNKFFQEFRLPMPEIPLLMPEFQNPLFLLLFCKAFQDRARKNKAKKQRQIFRGHEGATYIFETFVDSVSKRLSKQFGISNSPTKNVWDTIIEKIAEKMVNQSDDRITEEKVATIVKTAYPSIDCDHFIKDLDRNLLLIKVPRYSIEKGEYEGFDFRFPFQKFSNHLIGRYIFKKYEKEFGKDNKNLETAKKFFSKRRNLGKFLSKSWNRGIIEALSIQCPEHLKGCELVDVASYLRDFHVAQEAFVESLIWRKPDAFSTELKNTLAYINTEIIRTESGYNNLLNAFLSVAPIPNHPFSANFLHKHLSKFSMAKRDSWWSTFLHYQYGERGAVDRLIEWGWSKPDKANINDESIRLCSVALTWFLTTPNRFARDKSTKALVSLLTGRLNVVLALLQQFKDVNDSYVSERLYAIAYGCALRNREDKEGLKNLAQWVYNNIFRGGSPPVHILWRDYAHGIIEVALHKKIKITVSRKKIDPPFGSNWPKRVPSEKLLKSKYYPEVFFQKKTEDRGYLDIWSSVMYNSGTTLLGDFGNYVLNSAVSHWTGNKIGEKTPNRKKLFENFIKMLSLDQKELWDDTNPITYKENKKDNSFIIPSISIKIAKGRKTKDELNIANGLFKNSLSQKQRKVFEKDIAPFLDHNQNIYDTSKQFDPRLAQRWVFNRVVQLGWKQELHGQFDRNVNYNRADRSEHKPERIGKKYQWVALYELLARISDNFEFKEESWSDKIGKYEGSWQLSIRDIDPSCILKEFPNEKPEDVPVFSKNGIQSQYRDFEARYLLDIL